jgi:tight adherence protein B
MEIFLRLIGANGIILFIGIMIFIAIFISSNKIFDWVERKTENTRTLLMEKLNILFIDIKEEYITYFLLGLAFGFPVLIWGIFGMFSYWLIGFFVAVLFGFIGWKLPIPFVNFLIERRIKKYQSQMVDALTLLSNGIRAGLSVPQSLGMVVGEMPAPISQEFGVILQQNKIGVPLEECFDNLAKRVPTEDNDMFVSSVNILRETGGNLAETFDTIVSIIRERIRLQQKIDTYIAQGMFQGMTIAMMPFVIGAIYAASDPESIKPLFTHPIGIMATIAALTLDIVGGIIILKIVKIKV